MKKLLIPILYLIFSLPMTAQAYYMNLTLQDFELQGNVSRVDVQQNTLNSPSNYNSSDEKSQKPVPETINEFYEFNKFGLLTKSIESNYGRITKTNLSYSETGMLETVTIFETEANNDFRRYVKATVTEFNNPNFSAKVTITDTQKTNTKTVRSNKEEYKKYFEDLIKESNVEKNKKGLISKEIISDIIYRYEYQYDHKGNWFVRTTFENDIPKKVSIRQIEYRSVN